MTPAIQIPEDASNVTIGLDGTVSATAADGTALELGRIEIARFANPAGLQAIGGNMLVETQASGAPLVGGAGEERSEEHTSELQSLMRISYAVFCLKKKKKYTKRNSTQQNEC